MKNELFKFGVNNSKLKNTITFSKSSGITCPGANKCRAMAVMNDNGKRSVKRFKDTEFTCYSASLEALYPSLYNLTRHNTSLLNEYIKNDDFKGLVECLNASLNKKRSKNINLVRWNQSGDIYTRFELEALKKVCELNKDFQNLDPLVRGAIVNKQDAERFKVGYLRVRYNNLKDVQIIDVKKGDFQ